MNKDWRLMPALGSCVVEPQEEEQRTAAGLIVISPGMEKETQIVLIVEESPAYEAVASDRSIVQGGPIYKRGDLVVIGKYNGRDLVVGQPDGTRKKFIIIRESDVLGTLVLRTGADGVDTPAGPTT